MKYPNLDSGSCIEDCLDPLGDDSRDAEPDPRFLIQKILRSTSSQSHPKKYIFNDENIYNRNGMSKIKNSDRPKQPKKGRVKKKVVLADDVNKNQLEPVENHIYLNNKQTSKVKALERKYGKNKTDPTVELISNIFLLAGSKTTFNKHDFRNNILNNITSIDNNITSIDNNITSIDNNITSIDNNITAIDNQISKKLAIFQGYNNNNSNIDNNKNNENNNDNSPTDIDQGQGDDSDYDKKYGRGKDGRREKENLWKWNYRRNSQPPPVVVHIPKENLSALQTLHKSSSKALDHHYFEGGINHDWVYYYHRGITSDQSCINEWNTMDSLESKRPPSPDSHTDKKETELQIRSKLKEIMMSVDIDEVTSKYIRQRLEEDLDLDLFKFKSFIDEEMLMILGQMDAATEIFPHVYLGSEWNASNLEELQNNGVGFILNVTKEIDNFYPGTFDYLNIRVYDDEKTELLKHWDCTYKYINKAKEQGSKVLVHCKMGISRSASVVIAYAMKAYNIPLEDAFQMVKKKRSCIKPNQAFCSQLKTYQGILDASRQRHNALWRSKSETNLKGQMYRSNHLSSKHHRYRTNNTAVDGFDFGNLDNGSGCVNGLGSKESITTMSCQSLNAELPSPLYSKRPKSWSPDDNMVRMLFPATQESSDSVESWRRSQSLNDQTWQAHVTVEQREVRHRELPQNADEDLLVETVNPLYIIPQSNTTEPTSIEAELLMTSSVKDRISEFESVQSSSNQNKPKSPGASSLNSAKNPIFLPMGDYSPNTYELDQAIETLMSPSSDQDSSENSVIEVKSAYETVDDSLDQWTEQDQDQCNLSLDSPDHDQKVVIPNDPITWPSGIVKKQKQDFEEKVKLTEHSNKKDINCQTPLTTSSVDTSEEISQKNLDSILNPLVEIEKIMDKEKPIFQNKDLSSHDISKVSNNPAVIDRDMPTRHSSWGSYDNKSVAGNIPLRNSSFGAFDNKRFQCRNVDNSTSELPRNRYTNSIYDKVPVHVVSNFRKKKSISCDGKEKSDQEISPEAETKSNCPKPYTTAPIRLSTDRFSSINDSSKVPEPLMNYYTSTSTVPIMFRDHSHNNTHNINSSNMLSSLIIGPLSSPEKVNINSPTSLPYESSSGLNLDSLDYADVPVPGTVKQQKLKLELNKNEQLPNEQILKRTPEKLVLPNFVRSRSSSHIGKVDSPKKGINRSFSEKRSRFERGSLSGAVKKITKALEHQNCNPSDNRLTPTFRTRSQSLERLSTSPTSSCSTSSSTATSPSQNPGLPTTEDTEESQIQVKELVGRFEDTDKTLIPSKRLGKKKSRPRSDSVSDNILPPLVPQRKSSLDYNFRPAQRCTSQPPLTPVRQSSKSPTTKFPPSIPKPPSTCMNVRNQTCSTEVRQKKQQGKTHPLSKLITRENTTL